jgi:hypothetical protein
MSISVYAPTCRERELAGRLRVLAIAEIKVRDPDAVCKQLGFAPPALERLVWEPRWDLRVAFRVVDGLGLSVAQAILDSTTNATEAVA